MNSCDDGEIHNRTGLSLHNANNGRERMHIKLLFGLRVCYALGARILPNVLMKRDQNVRILEHQSALHG